MRAALLLLASSAALPAGGEPGWPDFRGPTRDGRAPADARVPLAWAEGENVAWKTAIHGRGWSSPVVLDGKVWLTTADEEGRELSVLCVDAATGVVLLDRVLFEVDQPQPRNAMNSYASPSPVLGPGRAYLCFGNEGLACLDGETFEVVWSRRDLRCDHMEGPGSSPLLHGGRLYVNVDGGDVQYVVAIDAETGETAWRTGRSAPLDALPDDLRKAYSTPIVVAVDGREELVSSGAQATVAYDPGNGAELWTARHGGFSMASRPVAGHGLVYVSTGYMRPELWALRPGGGGDVTQSHLAWKTARGVATMPSPVLAGELLFLVSDGGILSCVDARTGEEHWRERLPSSVCASLLFASGRVYAFDREGGTTVFAPASEPEVLAELRLEAGFMASPAVVGDALLLRTTTHLYRIEEAGE